MTHPVTRRLQWPAIVLGMLCPALAQGATPNLPGQYFRLLEAGADMVRDRLDSEPGADLAVLESRAEWRYFPYAILGPAVLYAKKHRQISRCHDPIMLSLPFRIGDLLTGENEKGKYELRRDSDWDT
jgi:hypothetical protein